MPLRAPTPQELDYFKQQGVDVDRLPAQLQFDDEPKTTTGQAVGRTLKAHAGGILGGGAGAIGVGSLLAAPETGGASLLIPLIATALAGAGGSYVGQKAQNALLGEQTTQKLQSEAQQAAEEHPIASGATDIVASALASGGLPKPSNIPKAIKGLLGKEILSGADQAALRQVGTEALSPQGISTLAANSANSKALRDVALNAVVNPAINTGIGVATTGELPSVKDLALQAAGGALFSGSNPLLHGKAGETQRPEPTSSWKDVKTTDIPELTAKPTELSPFKQTDSNSKPVIDDTAVRQAYRELVPKPDVSGMSEVDAYRAMTNWRRQMKAPVEEQRNALDQAWLSQSKNAPTADVAAPAKPEITATSKPEVTTPPVVEKTVPDLKAETPEDLQKQMLEDQARVAKLPDKPLQTETTQEKGIENATPPREVPIDNRTEHQGTEQVRIPTETSSSDSLQQGREVPKETKVPIERPLQFRGTESTIDQVRDIPHKAAPIVADAAQRALNAKGPMIGSTWGALRQKMLDLGYTKQDGEQLMKIDRWREEHEQYPPDSMFKNPRQKELYDLSRAIYEKVGQERVATKEPVHVGNTPRLLQIDPHSSPHTPDPKIVEEYKSRPEGEKVKQLDKIFLDNALKYGASEKEAQEALQNWKEGVQGSIKRQGGNLQFYNAIRRAQGIPLPEEFSRKDWAKNLEVYYNRAANDMSFHQHMESKPEVLSALGATQDAWGKPVPKDETGGIAGHPAVRALLEGFQGEIGGAGMHNEKGISNLTATAFIAWPGLQSHKLISNVVGATGVFDNPYQFSRALAHAVANQQEGYQHALENGVYKLTARSSLDMLDANATAADRMQALAHGIRKIGSLNDLTEKWNAGLMQSMMEQAVGIKLAKATAGDKTSQMFLRRLDPDYNPGKFYDEKGRQQLASIAASNIHGTGDARTMPPWMMHDTELSGFFKLAHWSVSQTNRFMTDILTPAVKNGNYAPLINSVFGAAIGGYIIKEVREQLAGKKSQLPSLSEIASSERGLSGNMGLLGYNLIAAAQYAGFGGLFSQVARYPFDFAYKNAPQGATFPLDEVVSSFAETVKDASAAIANDPNLNWLSLAQHVTLNYLKSNIQLARMGFNQAVNAGLITGLPAEKKELADKLGQLRRFDMVEGLPYNEQDQAGNPYMNLEQKRFKMTQSPEEASKMLPELVQNIIAKYSDNPDVMMQKIKALKQNTYATFPSMETTPLSFYKYLSFLNKTEGPAAAQEQLLDYVKHRTMNEAKASAVPL